MTKEEVVAVDGPSLLDWGQLYMNSFLEKNWGPRTRELDPFEKDIVNSQVYSFEKP